MTHYHSPIGEIFLSADEIGLTGLWFEQSEQLQPEPETPPIAAAKRWLDIYFSGQRPAFQPPLHLTGTDFQMEVWDILCTIPYGQTTTYGEIAKRLAARRGLANLSAQAVGRAVGRNPVPIIVPCHRVIGADGSLTGYVGGLERKEKLLQLEGSALRKKASSKHA